MRKLAILVLILVQVITNSCDKCNEGKKPSPASIFVEIINEDNENVFENESFSSTQIKILDSNNKETPFRFIKQNNWIQIFPQTINQEGFIFKIVLNNPITLQVEEINTSYQVVANQEECFVVYQINSLQSSTNEVSNSNGIYRIKI